MDDTVAPLLHWRQRRDSHTLVREDVAKDVREMVALHSEAILAHGAEIIEIKAALLALVKEAGGAT